MAEYIEKETMRGIIQNEESKHGLRGCGWIEMAMDKHPAADVAPVRHGRWERLMDGDMTSIYRCSLCNRRITVSCDKDKADARIIKLYPFCNCGAKMDEVPIRDE